MKPTLSLWLLALALTAAPLRAADPVPPVQKKRAHRKSPRPPS